MPEKKTDRIENMIKKYSLILIFVVSMICCSDALAISFSEIMFNPTGADTGREWIEMYSEGCIDLSECRLQESTVNHTISRYSNNTCCEYMLIIDDGKFFLDYQSYNFSDVCIYQSTFSLSNSGEMISIFHNNTEIASINYSAASITEGYSLIYEEDDITGSRWQQSRIVTGTPGYEETLQNIPEMNTTSNNTTNITVNDTQTNTTTIWNNTQDMSNSTSNASIVLNESFDIENNQSANFSGDLQHNSSNNMTGRNSINTCNISIQISIRNESVFSSGSQIRFKNTLLTQEEYTEDYIIEYWVEDLFGRIIRSKTETTNQNEKSFTPKIYENDRVYILRSQIKDISCANINNNTSASRQIIIRNNQYSEEKGCECDTMTEEDIEEYCETQKRSSKGQDIEDQKESKIDVQDIAIRDEEHEEIYLKINTYRGDTQKQIVEIKIIDEYNKTASDISKIRHHNKYSNITTEMQIHIEACKENRSYRLEAQGLDDNIIMPTGIICNKKDIAEKAIQPTSNRKNVSDMKTGTRALANNTQIKNVSTPSGYILYESAAEKNKRYSLIGAIAIAIGVTLYILYSHLHQRKIKPQAQ